MSQDITEWKSNLLNHTYPGLNMKSNNLATDEELRLREKDMIREVLNRQNEGNILKNDEKPRGKYIQLCPPSIEKTKLIFILIFFLLIMFLIMYQFLFIFASNKATNKYLTSVKSTLENVENLFVQHYKENRESMLALYRQLHEDVNQKMNHLYEELAKIKKKSDLNDKIIIETRKALQIATCSLIPEGERFDCHPESGASEVSCRKRNCCWKPVHRRVSSQNRGEVNVPYCYYSLNWKIYDYANLTVHENENDVTGFLKLVSVSPYKNDLPLVKIESTSIDSFTLRVKLYDPSRARYEPPLPIKSEPKSFSGTPSYELKIDQSIPGFSINRVSTGETLFNSNGVGGFIFANQFLQMSSLLSSGNIYGFGEHKTNLKLSTKWNVITLFNVGEPPVENTDLYGSHPFYMIIEGSGNCHGVLFLNSNAMDVIIQPTPAITFRTIGGIFDFYFFMGPRPADVLQQYSAIVGKPFLPPYWSLGFHLCKFGYGSLEKTKETWKRTKEAGIPFDTQWNDLDYMDRYNDFTYDKVKFKDLPGFVRNLHDQGMHYIPLIDAGISGGEAQGSYIPYEEGLKLGIFVKGSDDLPIRGKTWNLNSTVWPDFTNPQTREYYLKMMNITHESFEFDGAWIDMNEPYSFYDGSINGCPVNDLENPEYVPRVIGGRLARRTLCMSAQHYLGKHYDLHNTFGTSQAVATNYALRKIRNKRPFIISRSTWVGHGFYAGHWTGDIYSSWHDLRMSIPAILQFNLFQVPMVGADICGFIGNTTTALCNRWMQVGAFYPFSRNHNDNKSIEQDPVMMGELVVRSSRKALTIRYELLPHLYTLFFRAHQFGETVVRPLFFEFVTDFKTYDIDSQFLWGSSLMIVPVLDEISDKNQRVEAYIPRGKWYNLYSNETIMSNGQSVTLEAPLDTIPLLIRGGSILPMQRASNTTTASRQNDFGLLVALDKRDMAHGELYWDDGDSLDSIEKGQYSWLKFTVKNNILLSRPVKGSLDERMILTRVKIMGLSSGRVTHVFINNVEIENKKFHYDEQYTYLLVTNIQLDLKKTFTLSWNNFTAEEEKYNVSVILGLSSAAVSQYHIMFFLIIVLSLLCDCLLASVLY